VAHVSSVAVFALALNAVAAPPNAASSAPAAPAPAPIAKPAPTPAPVAKPAAAPAPVAKPAAAPAPVAKPATAPAPVAKPAAAPAPVAKPAAAPAPVAKPAAAPAPAAKPAAPSAEDRAALATRLVVLERAGKPLSLGVILNNDGRIAAAFTSLGDGRHVDARYSDGSVVPVRVGHADRSRDLALLVPQNAKHKLGLKASKESTAALNAPLGTFSLGGQRAVPGPNVVPTGPSAFVGNDGKPFPEALAFTTPVSPASAGSPLVDAKGEVIAIVTRACQKKPGAACAPVWVGTPVGLVREFLRTAPKTAAIPAASIGVQVAADDTGSARGVRVTSVRGPAVTSGLRAGADARVADVIVAIDGAPVTSPEAFDRAVEERAVGDVLDLLVFGSGRYRHLTIVVAGAPR
jgi:serine protease Do